jgi:hypothetical protein
VRVYDLTKEADIFIGHGAYADAPDAVRTIGAQIAAPRPQDANVQAVLGDKPVDDRIVASPLAPPPAPGAPLGPIPTTGSPPLAPPAAQTAAPTTPGPSASSTPASPPGAPTP